MIDPENVKLYHQAMGKWGFPAQATMVIEECSELIDAMCKYDRGRVDEKAVITEIADVMIMCEQMACYFGIVQVEMEKHKKLERLKERLATYDTEL